MWSFTFCYRQKNGSFGTSAMLNGRRYIYSGKMFTSFDIKRGNSYNNSTKIDDLSVCVDTLKI